MLYRGLKNIQQWLQLNIGNDAPDARNGVARCTAYTIALHHADVVQRQIEGKFQTDTANADVHACFLRCIGRRLLYRPTLERREVEQTCYRGNKYDGNENGRSHPLHELLHTSATSKRFCPQRYKKMANNIRFYQENADKIKERVRTKLSHKEKSLLVSS